METNKFKGALGLLRLSLGLVFLWAFFDKVFGLGFATVITLILVPCMYLIRYNLKARLFGKKEEKHAEVLEAETV